MVVIFIFYYQDIVLIAWKGVSWKFCYNFQKKAKRPRNFKGS